MSSVKHAITWVTRFALREQQWFHDPAMLAELLAPLAATAWWPLLEVIGPTAKGTPIGSVEDVGRRLLGAHATWLLASGGPANTIFTNEADVWLKIDLAPGYLGLGAGARRGALATFKERAIDDMIDVICALHQRWAGRAELQHATCAPTGEFSYSRPTPPRVANRPLEAVVDIVDPKSSRYGKELSEATPPPGCQRLERDGLVILRMVNDPAELLAMQQAAAAHEAWIGPVIGAPIDDEWEPEDE